VLLVAPTGIAAKRASSLTGLEAMTIHRAFGAGQPSEEGGEKKSDYEGVKKSLDETSKPKPVGKSTNPTQEVWKYQPHSPRDETVVIVDEASMVDLHLMWRMMRGISPKCRVIMVGDIEQLPPVGAGFVLFDLIKSRAIPRIHLSEIFRQGEGSGVAESAHSIHRGEVPQPNKDYLFVDRYTSQDILDTLVSTCKELQMEEVHFHVVSPTHHGKVGVTNLNRELRAVLNPSYIGGGFKGGKEIRVGKESIRVGDRVMVTKNEYDLGVFNGDIGKVQSIGRGSVDILMKGVQDQILSIPMDVVGRLLRLAYATTVHKSQGLEYDVIVMPMTTDHSSNLLQRPLLYTAITRAKDKVILIGDRDAVAICVGNVDAGTKYSRLHHRF
jgi:exodeoxyribonuclease V alpha subunit